MSVLDNQDVTRPAPPPAGAVALANEEAIRAWDTVLYERWKSNRKVFVGALSEVTEELFALCPPPEGGRCIDIGCGFGETSQRLAQLIGASGSVLGTDSSPRFIEDARREAAEAGVENIEFEVADAQTAAWDPVYDYAFSRMGTQFFAAPVPAMRAIRASLKPGGRLAKICWRRKAESPFWAETEQVVERFLSRPEEYEADTCGPGPFSLGNPETTRGGSWKQPSSLRSSCTSATSTTSWAPIWRKRSTRSSRSAPAPS
jgi:SAM-dependent methyltransferase